MNQTMPDDRFLPCQLIIRLLAEMGRTAHSESPEPLSLSFSAEFQNAV